MIDSGYTAATDENEFSDIIASLEKELNAKYQAVERCMSIRNKTNLDVVRSLAAAADDLCRQLIDKHKCCRIVNSTAINSIWANKHEFDTRLNDWLISVSGTTESGISAFEPVFSSSDLVFSGPDNILCPPTTTTTIVPLTPQSLHRSNSCASISVASSSRSSVEQRKALVKLKLAQIEAKQADERAKEKSARRLRELQHEAEEAAAKIEEESRESQRKLALATAEYEVWNDVALNNTILEHPSQTSSHAADTALSHSKLYQPCNSRDIPGVSIQYLPTTEENLLKSNAPLGNGKTYKSHLTADVLDVCNGSKFSKPEVICSGAKPNKVTVSNTLYNKSTTSSGVSIAASFIPRAVDSKPALNVIYSSNFNAQVASQPQNHYEATPVNYPPGLHHLETTSRYINPTAFQTAPIPSAYQRPTSVTLSQFDTTNFVGNNTHQAYDDRYLPRPEFTKFHGDPLEFKTFLNNFETHIVRKVRDPKILLCYLLQHCAPNIRERLQHFSNKGDDGFKLAKERLEREYGRPCVIADACEQQLKAFKTVRSNDYENIKKYAEILEKTLITLEDIRFFGSLNSLDTMAQLINKLPYEWRRTWVKESVQLERETGQVAEFSDFVKFVNRLSDEANSLYGRRVLTVQNTKTLSKVLYRPDTRKPANSYNVVASKPTTSSQSPISSTFACFYCKDATHGLLNCSTFKIVSLQERSAFIKQNKMCYKCLSSTHRTRTCTKQKTCTIKGCTGTYHHTLLHPVNSPNNESSSKDITTSAPAQSQEKDTDKVVACSTINSTDKAALCSSVTSAEVSTQIENAVYLCVVPVKVSYNGKQVATYAFLDQGSTNTFCNKTLINALGISGTPDQIVLHTLTGSVGHKGFSCQLTVTSLNEQESFVLPNVLSIDNIPMTPNAVPTTRDLIEFPHLRGLQFPKIRGATVTLLIGADVPEVFHMRSIRKGTRGQPIAVEFPLGLFLLGPSLSFSSSRNCSVNFIRSDPILQSQISRLWETDFGNETSVFDMPTSKEDRIAYDIMVNSVKHVAGHYQLPLLWRPHVELPGDSREMAQRRLASLKKRLASDSVLCDKYVNVMETYINKGYAMPVPNDRLISSNINWYLPHHPVLNPRKPEKVRVVFDCAAKHKGISLNDALYQGPVLTNTLVGVLIRFRKNPIALVADIEQMFHQVKTKPDDCDALRFLWWPDGSLNETPIPYQMLVHLFGATSSPSCAAFSLRQTAYDFGKQFDPFVTNLILNNFYVDDCLCSVSSVAEGIKVIKQLPKLLLQGGFHLTKWLTNNKQVLETIPVTERSSSLQRHELNGDVKERVLGIYWNVRDDEFGFDVVLQDKPFTRRGILSTVSSLYDPLGFVAPIILEPKLMLQNLCKQGLGWDSEISAAEVKRWKLWLGSLSSLSNFRINRCIKPDKLSDITTCEIHHFADASSFAYGTSCYIRLVNNKGKIYCFFLIGKSRLAPIKAVSIPRLELTAAVLSVKLDKLVHKELDMPECRSTFWTDSTAVLLTIRNARRKFPVFVANRLSIIERHCDISQWRYVPSKLNPADLASRGTSVDSLISPNSWISGPEFLWESDVNWPLNLTCQEQLPEDFVLKRKEAVVTAVVIDRRLSTDRLLQRYSSLPNLLKTTAWLMRYKCFLLFHVRKRLKLLCTEFAIPSRYPSVEELEYAKFELIKYVQFQHFSSLIKLCSSENPTLTRKDCSNSMRKLQPMIVDGVLRVGGRLERAPVQYGNKHPVILPNYSPLTDLFIYRHHLEVGHSGVGHTWTSLRQQYWIIKGSSAVRRVIGNCILCKKRNASVCKQIMADLPECRLQPDSPPFTHVGVDYFGPLFVKQGRSRVKRYGCLFSCLTMRAIHIEITPGLDTNSFLNALRRFISRRSNPHHIYSDNGTNFVGAERVLRDSLKNLNQHQINDYLTKFSINWHFSPPTASHFNGS